jgi:hypothetical protein
MPGDGYEAAGRPGGVIAGRYRLVRPLGAGGFGRVWLAVDEVMQLEVAAKEVWLHPGMQSAERAERLARAEREFRNAARLRDHPAIVSVHDVAVHDGTPWIIMQRIHGRSLQELLDAQGPVPPQQAAQIADSVLGALDAAHAAQIVHRDVKPANVMLTDDGRVLLADFGIAQQADDTALTATGALIGSVEYLAPERAQGRGSEPAGDLFSLGVTLFHAVEGYSPFRRENPADTLSAILFEPTPLLRKAGPLASLIQALLIKDPALRANIPQAGAMIASAADATRTAPEAAPGPVAAPGPAGSVRPDDDPTRSAPAEAEAADRVPVFTARRGAIALSALVLLAAVAVLGVYLGVSAHGASPAANSTPNPSTSAGSTADGVGTGAISGPPTTRATTGVASTQASQAENPPPAPSSADAGAAGPVQVRSPDFNGFCEANGEGPVALVAADEAYGWRCTQPNSIGDNATDVCQWTNQSGAVIDTLPDYDDPNSWQCWTTSGELGPIDWNTYCADKGWGTAVDTGQNDAYTWTCSATDAGLDAQDACDVLYSTTTAIARFQDYFDENSWQCWD